VVQLVRTRQFLPWARAAATYPGATLLMLAFGPTRLRSLVGGVSWAEAEAAFAGWELLAVESADTAGLGWPMNKTAPPWYRFRWAHDTPPA
jgi:hypothetical protein